MNIYIYILLSSDELCTLGVSFCLPNSKGDPPLWTALESEQDEIADVCCASTMAANLTCSSHLLCFVHLLCFSGSCTPWSRYRLLESRTRWLFTDVTTSCY